MNKEKQKIVPELRFPEFENDEEWKEKTLGNIAEIVTGTTPKTSESENYGGIKLFASPADISGKRYISETKKTLSEKGFSKSRILPKNSVLFVCIGSTIGKIAQNKIECATNQQINSLIPFENHSNDFIYSLLEINSARIATLAGHQAVPLINKTDFSEILVLLPPTKLEQQKIANCLTSLDNLITAESEKLEHLKAHKKGLLQQLFPAKGETKPQFRFPEFVGEGEWEETTLEKCLNYLQPTPYLVSSTDYEDKFKTPVLTAGKTFILGYTDEKEGIFNENLPVIIFDDFTTATKFVDFPFKAKSSAMKILLAKGDNNIKFLFETIQNLKFEVSTHKRHWISVYSKLVILKPKDPKEHQKIADCFSSADDLIAAQTTKIEALKAHKKGLMQQLFPNV